MWPFSSTLFPEQSPKDVGTSLDDANNAENVKTYGYIIVGGMSVLSRYYDSFSMRYDRWYGGMRSGVAIE